MILNSWSSHLLLIRRKVRRRKKKKTGPKVAKINSENIARNRVGRTVKNTMKKRSPNWA